ncbi:MAG: hypothetical protein GY866_17275 [Proteobacteria bacterium]|nr:hypothetical protein [Pseudomonadota bacterium]
MASEKKRNPYLKVLMILIPVVIGLVVFAIMSYSRKPPKQKEAILDIPTVRVLEVSPIDVVPRAVGYGTAQPIRTWKAVAQARGRIIYTHPQLQKGSIIKQGVELLKTDPTEYRINATKIKAGIQNLKVQIEQLNVQKKNYLKLLDLQKTDLKIKQKEIKRQSELYKKKIISKTQYESQLHVIISQEVQVQNIQNSLNLIPVQLELLQIQLDQARSDLESANLQLSYTTISAPFDIQIATINNELSEFVQVGQTILEANDISETEVEAQFLMKSMRPVFLSVRGKVRDMDSTTISIGKALGVSAKIRLAGFYEKGAEWNAVFNRRSDTLDTETRTTGLIVSVQNDLSLQGKRQGRFLLKGAYCEVELSGPIQKNMIVMPRNALHPQDVVFLMDTGNRLVKKQIETLYTMSDFVVVKEGLKAGDTVILSDIVPAVDGMKVDPVVDNALLEKLITDAGGE